MQAFTIRRLLPADVEVYRSLMLEAYDRHPDAFMSTAAERAPLPLSWWEKRVSPEVDADERVLGAFGAEGLVGVAGLAFEKGTKARHKAKLFGMYVHESQRGQSLGRRLVEAVLAEARERPGVLVVQLTVTQGNLAAEELYRRCGFETFGVEPMAMALGDGFVAKVHMVCVLERAPQELERELPLTAAIDGYQQGRISMERAAEMAGCTRSEFLAELARRRVDVFRVDFEDLRQELVDS